MKTLKTLKTLASASAISLLALTGVSAHAGGFLADTFIRPFSPELATQADRWNAQNGRPVERAVAAAADAYVPGTGAVLSAGWAIQYSGMLNGGPAPIPAPPPVMQQPVMQQPFMQPVAMPQQNLGSFCYTPAGRFGPGPVNQIGAPCWVNLPMGTLHGQVGM